MYALRRSWTVAVARAPVSSGADIAYMTPPSHWKSWIDEVGGVVLEVRGYVWCGWQTAESICEGKASTVVLGQLLSAWCGVGSGVLIVPRTMLALASARKKGRRKKVEDRIEEGVVESRGSRSLESSCWDMVTVVCLGNGDCCSN